MPQIGVLELKTHASAIIRAVREKHARYVVTHRGRPVGLLLPLDDAADRLGGVDDLSADDAWEELMQLGQEMAQGWPAGLTGADLLTEMRR